ncbi:DUF6174 domain-containing protein [Aliinostoc sp. HNIBRCY26]|uniref:DUF6174 domain-containing protein n=1 Tax=Aliinostoc sp. HNIBRCY26 TaxID=3418997 RepID=UPI003CFDE392
MTIDQRSLQTEGKPVPLRMITILSVFSIAGVAIFSHQLFWKHYFQNRLTQAKKTWETQAVSHYRLQINYSAPFNCQQEVEIKNEKVIAVGKNTCASVPLVTVSELFQEISSIADGNKCGPNGCICDGQLGFKATYDNHFGYPNQLEISLDRQHQWLNFRPLNDHSGKYCTLIGFVGKRISVSGFTPIPS